MYTTEAVVQELQGMIDGMLEPRRTQIRPVLEHMKKFAACPAGTGGRTHGAFEGGLLEHSLMVIKVALALASDPLKNFFSLMIGDPTHFQKWKCDLTETLPRFAAINTDSIVTAGLIHDLNKTCDFTGNAHYIPNILKSGKRSEPKPWEINKDAGAFKSLRAILSNIVIPTELSKLQPLAYLLDDDAISVRDGLVSLCLAYRLSPGLNGTLSEDEINAIVFHDGAYAGRTGLQDKETVLQIIIHAADMISSRFLC